jgi:hypothetical protein
MWVAAAHLTSTPHPALAADRLEAAVPAISATNGKKPGQQPGFFVAACAVTPRKMLPWSDSIFKQPSKTIPFFVITGQTREARLRAR